jgi:predicted component of type VI protein secretion system
MPTFRSKLSAADTRTASSSLLEPLKLDTRKIVNVVIAKDFNFAPIDVQIQVLEVRQLIERRHDLTDIEIAYPQTLDIQPNHCSSCP